MKKIIAILFLLVSSVAYGQKTQLVIFQGINSEIRLKPSYNNLRSAAILDTLNKSMVNQTGSYADPSWITSLAGSKITGTILDALYMGRTMTRTPISDETTLVNLDYDFSTEQQFTIRQYSGGDPTSGIGVQVNTNFGSNVARVYGYDNASHEGYFSVFGNSFVSAKASNATNSYTLNMQAGLSSGSVTLTGTGSNNSLTTSGFKTGSQTFSGTGAGYQVVVDNGGGTTGTIQLKVQNTSSTEPLIIFSTPSNSGIRFFGTGATAGNIIVAKNTLGDGQFAPLDLSLAAAVGTSRLAYANLTAPSTTSLLLGRSSSSTGNWQEITLGTGLSMSGTTLNVTVTGGTVTSIATTSPITGGTITGSGTIGINNASVSQKGAAQFNAPDFDDDGSGIISLDYVNGQMATGSVNGFVSTTTQTFAGAKTFSGNATFSAKLSASWVNPSDFSLVLGPSSTVGAISNYAILNTTPSLNIRNISGEGIDWYRGAGSATTSNTNQYVRLLNFGGSASVTFTANHTGATIYGLYYNPIIAGTQSGNVTNYAAVFGSGRVGINTLTPTENLHVASGNILLGGAATAGLLKFAEPSGSGSNFSSFAAQAQSADINYTWPASVPASNGYALTSTTGGTMSWSAIGNIGGSTGATDNAVLRADGTGGATVQNSAVTIDDNGNINISGAGNQTISTTTASAHLNITSVNNGVVLNANGGQYFALYPSYVELGHSGQFNVNLGGAMSVTVNDNLNSSIRYLASTHTVTGSPAVGTGTGISFTQETTAGNFQAGSISVVSTNVGSGTESFNMQMIASKAGGDSILTLSQTDVNATVPYKLKSYTVSTLPTGSQGMLVFVTDATSPIWGATVVGGGSSIVPVFYDGTNWVVH